MRAITILLAMGVGVAGCVEVTPGTGFGPPLNKPPMSWTEEDDAQYGDMLLANPRAGFAAFCNNYRQGRAGGQPLTQADYEDYEKVFRAWGMTSRDISLLRRRDQVYGTEQTWLGLQCSVGFTPRVNRSFYQGVGHQWQAILGEYSGFVYLNGDGTDTGMRVKAWN